MIISFQEIIWTCCLSKYCACIVMLLGTFEKWLWPSLLYTCVCVWEREGGAFELTWPSVHIYVDLHKVFILLALQKELKAWMIRGDGSIKAEK
jgi:hypothetical protein